MREHNRRTVQRDEIDRGAYRYHEVGEAVNRALTAAAARAGRGTEVIVGLGEDPRRGVERLLARTSRPLAVGLDIEGSAVLAHAPARLPDLYAGTPAMVALELRPESGELCLRAHPSWHDLDAGGRIAVFEATSLIRELEAALDDDGLSGTARAVLARIRSHGAYGDDW